MKKLIALLLALVMVLSAAAALAADDHPFNPEDGANPAKTEYHFVYIPKLVHPYYDAIRAGMESTIADYAAKGVTITLDWDAPAQADALVQVSKLEAAAAKRPDAISLAMQDPAILRPVMAEVQASGIPIIVNEEGEGTTFEERVAFCGIRDLYSHGVMLGEAVAKAIDYKGEVAMLIGTKSSVAHTERTRGIKDALAQYKDITIAVELADEDDMEKAMNLTEQILTAYPNVKAITSSNGGAHVGAARAIESAGKAGQIVIGGYDAIEETVNFIRSGVITCVIAEDCKNLGHMLICEMIEAADGKITEFRESNHDVFVLTKDNLDDLPKYGYNY